MTIAQAYRQLLAALATHYEEGEAASVARIVFEDAFSVRNFQREDALPSHQLALLARIQSRLLAGEPVQYVLGAADFFGLKFRVDPRVLIPRQETEELVLWVLDTVGHISSLKILDIGAGSGCIPIVLKKRRPDLEVHALDNSPGALAVARENADRLGTRIIFHQVDILDSTQWPLLPEFDILVSNPPYIPPSEAVLMPEQVLQFEPAAALFTATEDALVFYRTIAEFAADHLLEGGWLFFETNEFNAGQVRQLLEDRGFTAELRQDIHGKDRMVRGRK